MSTWDDRFSQHPIRNTLASIKECFDREELVTDDINIIGLLDRVRQAVTYTETCLGNVLPALVNHGNLDKANSYLTQILSELNSYASNRNAGHLNNIAPQIDSLIPQLHALPRPLPSIENDSYSAVFLSFKSLVEKTLSRIKEEKDELNREIERISVLTKKQDDALSNLAKNIEKYDESIDESLSEFGQQFEEVAGECQKRLEEQIAENNKILTEALKTSQEEHYTIAGKLEADNDDFIEQLKIDSSNILKVLSDKRDEASKLVQIIGNIGITGNYQNIANEEKKAADKWRNIALCLMIIMVLIIGATIFCVATEGFDWKLAAFRLTAALILIVPATYAAKESSRHRSNEAHNRRAELELASLDPFLEKLPVEKREKIKEKLTDKFFGQQVSRTDDEPVTHNVLLDLLKLAISKK